MMKWEYELSISDYKCFKVHMIIHMHVFIHVWAHNLKCHFCVHIPWSMLYVVYFYQNPSQFSLPSLLFKSHQFVVRGLTLVAIYPQLFWSFKRLIIARLACMMDEAVFNECTFTKPYKIGSEFNFNSSNPWEGNF